MVIAPSGWGKSRLLGRRISFQDTKDNIGQIILDVNGQTIDNLLDRCLFEKETSQRALGNRMLYCNMAGARIGKDTFVSPWSILFKRDGTEPLDNAPKRVIELMEKTDERLRNASVMGMNRLVPQLQSFGICLTAMGEPLVSVFDMLEHPYNWQHRIKSVSQNPECREAANSLLSFFAQSRGKQIEETGVLKNKLSFLRFNLADRAMFSTNTPPIDWEEVAVKGQTVLIDLRGLKGEALSLRLFWVWNSLMDYILQRTRSSPPLAVVIDELSFFVRGSKTLNTEQIVEDFRELIQVRKRNPNVWLTLATQEISELPQGMLTACLSMGSIMLGATVDKDTALLLTERFDTIDPYKLKDSRPTFGYKPHSYGASNLEVSYYTLTGDVKTFFTFDEQRQMNSQKYLDIPKEDWYMAQARFEGHMPRRLIRVTTRNLDPGQYVN